MRLLRLISLGWLVPVALPGQAVGRVPIIVRDASETPVSWAVVRIDGSTPQIADDSGRVWLVGGNRDSVRVSVRRMGFRPFDGWVLRSAEDGTFKATLPRLALALDAVTVTAARTTPLERTGFYDRVIRARRGATVAEFITPEELEERNPGQLSQIFAGTRYTTIRLANVGARQLPVLLGRGQCQMTILVDGMRVAKTVQDEPMAFGPPQSIDQRGSRSSRDQSNGADSRTRSVMGLDDLVDGRSVMAIEIYPSTANAPAELISIGGRGSCGFVAIWTGARR